MFITLADTLFVLPPSEPPPMSIIKFWSGSMYKARVYERACVVATFCHAEPVTARFVFTNTSEWLFALTTIAPFPPLPGA